MQEQRFLNYQSNLERFKETTKGYDYSDPLQAMAGGVNVITQGLGLDPALKDLGRSLDGNKAELPPYGSFLGRTIANVRETISDLFHLKFFSAVTKVINVPGDAIADGADMVAGVHRSPRSFIQSQ